MPFLAETARAFGLSGSRSLEYIGLVLQNGAVTARKVYHLADKPKPGADDRTAAVWDAYFREMDSRYAIELCDISKGGNEMFPSFRMVVLFREKLSSERTHALADSCLQTIPPLIRERFLDYTDRLHALSDPSFSPLMQIGVETDAQNRLLGMKYYLNLDLPKTDNAEASRKLAEILSALPCKQDAAAMAPLAAKLMECRYAPAFIGVNDSGDSQECKLYFVSKLFGRSLFSEAGTQISAMCSALHTEPQLCPQLQQALEEYGLYPQGVALSADSNHPVRLYLKEIPANQRRHV